MSEHQSPELMRLVGEISADTKHILLRQDRQDDRLDRHSEKIDKLEKFQWKVMGIATTIPAVITVVGLWLSYIK